ncbi:MAG: aldo/keto reductase [Actinobacteria bacterium]|nr:MAG: aldo/keto reductase [Actinomycetota bacterium]
MQRRRLGRTGHESSVAILGGAAFALSTTDEAEPAFASALARGVNHLDIAPRYGQAERAVGPLVPPVRDRLFIGEKTTRRASDGVRAQLDESLQRLGTDHVDLYQMHAVTGVDVLDERRDAAATIMRARDEGLTRFVGITGHGLAAPATFVEALDRYDLDTVMFPVYPRLWADVDYRRAAEQLLSICAERDLGVMAIKAVARQPWGDDDRDRFATTWYEPRREPDSIARGVHFALSTPGVHAFCTPGDLGLLPLALDAAERATTMDDDARLAAMDEMAGLAPLQTP